MAPGRCPHQREEWILCASRDVENSTVILDEDKGGVVKIFIDGEAINPVNPPGELGFCEEEVNVVVDAARRHGLRVACHARSAADVKRAVRAGVDFVGHANYSDEEAVELLAARNDAVCVGPAIAWEVH